MTEVWLVVGGALLIVLVVLLRLRGRRPTHEEVVRQFSAQREHLEADFLRAAAATGKPRGLRWLDCDWEDLIEFARERATGRYTAIVGVTVRFEAVEGSDMEGLPAVANLRNASGLFVYDGRIWIATGRVIFNLNPDEVLARFAEQYEPLAQS